MTRLPSLALIGNGWAAETYARATQQSGAGSVRWLVARNAAAGQTFCHRFHISQLVLNIQDLAPPGECSLVIVCIPPRESPPVIAGLLSRGYCVLAEKPGAESSHHLAGALLKCSAPQVRRLAFAYQLFHDDRVVLAREVIRSGTIGRPERAHLKMHMPTEGWSTGRRGWALGPGATSVWVEAGVHLTALAAWLFGPAHVVEVSNQRVDGHCVAGTALLKHQTGVVSTLDVSFLGTPSAPRGGVRIEGSAGRLHLSRGTYLDKRSLLRLELPGGRTSTTSPAPENGTLRLLNRALALSNSSNTLATSNMVDHIRALEYLRLAESLETRSFYGAASASSSD